MLRLLCDLQSPERRDSAEAERDHLANVLFGAGSGQQDLDDCLRALVEHIVSSKSVLHLSEQVTCSLCATNKTEETEAPFVFAATDTDEATLEDVLDVKFTAVEWNCGKLECPASLQHELPANQRVKHATHGQALVGELPSRLVVLFKRKGFSQGLLQRNTTKIEVQSEIMVRSTVNGEIVIAAFTPVYLVFHSSSGDPHHSANSQAPGARSAYNVTDTECPESCNGDTGGGHYFGGLVTGDTITFYDDLQEGLSPGNFEDLNARGRKIVGVVLRKVGTVCSHGCTNETTTEQCSTRSCTGVSCRLCSTGTQLSANEVSDSWRICLPCLRQRDQLRAMVTPFTKKDEVVEGLCHRIANQVFLYLAGNDAADAIEPFVEWVGQSMINRRDRVRDLFRENGAACRRIVLHVLACMWKARIMVHDLHGVEDAEEYGPDGESTITFVVALHESVVYPTSSVIRPTLWFCGLPDDVEVMPTYQQPGGGAEFDTIIHLIAPFISMIFTNGTPAHVECLPPSLRNTDAITDYVSTKVPIKKGSAYWCTRRDMKAAGVNSGASLLLRSAQKDTVIECSYAMIFAVVQCVEMFFPFTSDSKHIILGSGRRGGMLIQSIVDKDITVVAVERGEVFNEGCRLQGMWEAGLDGNHSRPKLAMVQMDAAALGSLDGFTSASRFVGGKGASIDLRERNLIDKMVLTSGTMKVYWNCHLTNLTDLGLPDDIVNQWKVFKLPGGRQEAARFQTLVAMRVKQSKTETSVSEKVQGMLACAEGRPVYADHLVPEQSQWDGPRKSARIQERAETREVITLDAEVPTKEVPTVKSVAKVAPASPASTTETTKRGRPAASTASSERKTRSTSAGKKKPRKTSAAKEKPPKETPDTPARNLHNEFDEVSPQVSLMTEMIAKLTALQGTGIEGANSAKKQIDGLSANMSTLSAQVRDLNARGAKKIDSLDAAEAPEKLADETGAKSDIDVPNVQLERLRDDLLSADRKENNALLHAIQNTVSTKERDLLWLEQQRNNERAQHRDKETRDIIEKGKKKKKKKKAEMKERLRWSERSRSRPRERSRLRRGERSRSRERSKSRGRARSRRRERSRSNQREQSRSRSRRRGRTERSPTRSRRRSRSPRKKSLPEAKNLKSLTVSGITKWLGQQNFSVDIRNKFAEDNICGADLEHLTIQQLIKLGMQDHNVARFNQLI